MDFHLRIRLFIQIWIPQAGFQIHHSILKKRNSFLFKQPSLFGPSWSASSLMIDHSMAWEITIIFCFRKNTSNQPGVSLSAAQSGNQSIGCGFSFRNFIHHAEDLINHVLIHILYISFFL